MLLNCQGVARTGAQSGAACFAARWNGTGIVLVVSRIHTRVCHWALERRQRHEIRSSMYGIHGRDESRACDWLGIQV